MVMRALGIPAEKLTSWSVAEDSVSMDMDMTAGGFSEYHLEGAGGIEPALVVNKSVILDDVRFGRTHAVARALTTGPWSWSATLNDPFYLLDVEGYIEPRYWVTVSQVIQEFFKVAGVKEPPKMWVQPYITRDANPFLDSSIAWESYWYTFPGGKGNLWSVLKNWLASVDFQVTWVYDTIVVFKNHTVLTRLQGYTSDYKVNYAQSEPASSIECTYYEDITPIYLMRYRAGFIESNGAISYSAETHHAECPTMLIWPPVNANNEVLREVIKGSEVLSVEAGETKEFVLETPNLIKSIKEQPVCIDPKYIGHFHEQITQATRGGTKYAPPYSVYTVVGKDNKPITPAQWRAEGGRLTVELGDEPNQLKVTVTGMLNKRLGPYRIAESDGQNDYSTLRIYGQALPCEEKVLTFYTGYPYKTEPLKISSRFIDSLDKAYAACMYAAQDALGTKVTLEWSGMPPVNDSYTSVVYDFERPPVVLSDADDFTGQPLPAKAEERWPKNTTMDKIYNDLVSFTSNRKLADRVQVFGRLAGTTAVFDRYSWQITSANYSETGIDLTCEGWTTLWDVMNIFDTPRVEQLEDPTGLTLEELTLRGFKHHEA